MDFNEMKSICRGCLATERKMYSATLYEAEFKDLTGITISPSDGLPQWLCYECIALLQKCVRFGNKVMKSHYTLCKYVQGCALFAWNNDNSHLRRTVVSHCDIPPTIKPQTEQREENTVVADIVKSETTNVKSENNVVNRLLFIDDNDMNKANSCVGNIITIKNDVNDTSYCNLTELEAKNMCLTLYNEERTGKREVAKQISQNRPSELNLGSSVIKTESPDSDCENINPEQDWRSDQPSVLKENISIRTYQSKRKLNNKDPIKKCDKLRHQTLRGQHHSNQDTGIILTPQGEDYENIENVNSNSDINDNAYTNIETFICNDCNKYFNTKLLLIDHIREHSNKELNILKPFTNTGVKSHKCNACCRYFHTSDSLKVHYRIHTGEKPYKCEICMKCFMHAGMLRKHRHSHTYESPYKCDVCYKGFSLPARLTTHYRTHFDKKIKCGQCMKCFSTQEELKSHVKRISVISHLNVIIA